MTEISETCLFKCLIVPPTAQSCTLYCLLSHYTEKSSTFSHFRSRKSAASIQLIIKIVAE